MRSTSKSFKIPCALLEAVEHLRQPGQPLADYPSTNAFVIGLIAYAVAFPRPHELTASLSRLHPDDQDKVHDFLLMAVKEGIDLRTITPKPVAAETLLALARAATKPSTKKQGSPPAGSVTS